jgi:hypothetical protein
MKALVMPSYTNENILLTWAASLLASVGLLSVPPQVWDTVLQYINVPDQIKELVNPLLGAICIILVQAIHDYYKRLTNPKKIIPPTPHWIFGSKIFVGWVVGINAIPLVQPFLTASGPRIAFWAGAVGFGLIGGLVELIIAAILKSSDQTKP